MFRLKKEAIVGCRKKEISNTNDYEQEACRNNVSIKCQSYLN